MAKKPQTLASALKADRKLDAKMSPAMIRKDIASDKKLLAQKVKKAGKK